MVVSLWCEKVSDGKRERERERRRSLLLSQFFGVLSISHGLDWLWLLSHLTLCTPLMWSSVSASSLSVCWQTQYSF